MNTKLRETKVVNPKFLWFPPINSELNDCWFTRADNIKLAGIRMGTINKLVRRKLSFLVKIIVTNTQIISIALVKSLGSYKNQPTDTNKAEGRKKNNLMLNFSVKSISRFI